MKIGVQTQRSRHRFKRRLRFSFISSCAFTSFYLFLVYYTCIENAKGYVHMMIRRKILNGAWTGVGTSAPERQFSFWAHFVLTVVSKVERFVSNRRKSFRTRSRTSYTNKYSSMHNASLLLFTPSPHPTPYPHPNTHPRVVRGKGGGRKPWNYGR